MSQPATLQPRKRRRRKYGYIAGLGTSIVIGNTSTWVDCWAYGGARTTPTTHGASPAVFTPYMASSNDSDTQAITFEYIDLEGHRVHATRNLTGQTPLALPDAQELARAWNSSNTNLLADVAFTSANNFTNGAPDNQAEVCAYIGVDDQQTMVFAERVPTAKKFQLIELKVKVIRASGGAGSIVASFDVREPNGVFRNRQPIEASDADEAREDMSDTVLRAGSDYRLRIRDVSDNSTSVRATLTYDEIDL